MADDNQTPLFVLLDHPEVSKITGVVKTEADGRVYPAWLTMPVSSSLYLFCPADNDCGLVRRVLAQAVYSPSRGAVAIPDDIKAWVVTHRDDLYKVTEDMLTSRDPEVARASDALHTVPRQIECCSRTCKRLLTFDVTVLNPTRSGCAVTRVARGMFWDTTLRVLECERYLRVACADNPKCQRNVEEATRRFMERMGIERSPCQ